MKRLSEVLPASPGDQTGPPAAGGQPERTPLLAADDPKVNAFFRGEEERRRAEAKCSKCGDAGWTTRRLPPNHPDFGKIYPCDCQQQQQHQTYLLRAAMSHLPTATAETHRFATWKQLRHLQHIFTQSQRFAAGHCTHHFLTLVGRSGTGKTHLALAIAWGWLESGRGTVFYYQVEELLDALRAGYNTRDPTATEHIYGILNLAMTASLLVLDDLGAEKSTEWAEAKLDEIVDNRYINRRPMVVTTNLGMSSLAPRISDRLAEGQVHILKTGSYRQREKGSQP